MVSRANLKSRVVVAIGIAVAVGAGAAVLRTDLLLDRGFDPVFEIKAAYFTDTWEYPCGCPI